MPGRDELWVGWVTSMEGRGLSRKTIRSRRTFFNSWCDWIGGRFYVATHHDIEAWMAANRDRWAPESRKRGFNDIRQLYRWCERDDLVPKNPAALAWGPKVPRAQPRPASTEALDAALTTGRLEDRMAIALMAYGGLRCLEVAGLQCGQVDFGDGIMWITGKNGQQRFVFINRDLRPWLAALDGAAPHDPVYTGMHGRAGTPTTVTKPISHHSRAAGYAVTAHQFRHYYGTRLLEQCGRLEVVRDQMGHKSTATTEIYVKLARERIRQAALMF